MRHERHVPELEELGVDLGLPLEDVEAGAGDRAVAQRSGERRCSAAASAASSTIGPRAVLTRYAELFMAVNCSAPIRWCVAGP